jgi:hypothetical protein
MVRRRKKARTGLKSKRRFDVLISRIIVCSLYIASIALIVDTLYSVANPYDYPTSNLQDIVKKRSYVQVGTSCVIIAVAPINFGQRYEIDINMLGEIECRFNQEIYMTDFCSPTGVTIDYIQFLEVDEVHNFEAFIDGERLDCRISEAEGVRFYNISGFNMAEIGKVYKLQILGTFQRTPGPSSHIRTPLIFNENYSIYLGIPMSGDTPLHIGSTSDLSTLKVNFGMPYRRIEMKMSGWLDDFYPPENEWEEFYEQYHGLLRFRFPLIQDFEREGSNYLFSIFFSENNNGTAIGLHIVPDYEIPALLLLFLLSPFYVPLFEVIKKKSRQQKHEERAKPDNKKTRSTKEVLVHNGKQILFSTLELYSGPILGLLAIARMPGVSFTLVSYIVEIANPVLLLLIIMYPAMFRFFLAHANFRKFKQPT